MLKKLTIHNFKSFYNSTFEFGKLNCLIAPNNTGKSNLIEAIEFIDNLLFKKDEEKLILKDLKNFRHNEENILLNPEFELNNSVLVYDELISYKCDVKINITIGKINNIEVQIEGFIKSIQIPEHDKITSWFSWSMLRAYGHELYDSIQNYSDYKERLEKKRYSKFSFSYTLSTLKYYIDTNKALRNTVINLIGLHLDSRYNLIQPMDFKHIFTRQSVFESFYFHAHAIKEQQLTVKADKLNKYGTNLVEFLSGLPNETIEDISTSFIGEVEQVNGIEIIEEAYKKLYFIEDNTYKIPLSKTSDGTVHFVSLMSAILGNNYSMSIMIEEPERHMHMKVLSYILNTMRDDDKQIFFTTHSTEMLSELELDEIIFMFRDFNGDTKGIRAKEIKNIKKIMKIYKNDIVEMIKIGILDSLEDELL